jgi:hypothetical protein
MSFLNLTKSKFGKKALALSFYYICIVELSFYTLLIVFFTAFATQLNMIPMQVSTAIVLLFLVTLFVFLKNYIRYNGKRRNVLNAKSKTYKLQFWKLILAPVVCLVLAIVFFQAI